MSRFLISCGGTGGHLSPGIALAEGLRDRGHESRLLISRKQVDARLSGKYPDLGFERMPGTGFSWRPLALARCVLSQAQAFWFCVRLIRRFRPQAVIGFGVSMFVRNLLMMAGAVGIMAHSPRPLAPKGPAGSGPSLNMTATRPAPGQDPDPWLRSRGGSAGPTKRSAGSCQEGEEVVR